jgi:hypothetical protein
MRGVRHLPADWLLVIHVEPDTPRDGSTRPANFMVLEEWRGTCRRYGDGLRFGALPTEQSYGESLHLAQNKMSATCAASAGTEEEQDRPTEHWTAPPEGWVKHNFDAAFLAETGEASTGVTIRYCIGGGMRCSRHGKPRDAEAEACMENGSGSRRSSGQSRLLGVDKVPTVHLRIETSMERLNPKK